MSISPEQFWRSNYYKHPTLTDEMVSAAERRLGVSLPKDYLRFLYIQNGGYTNEFVFPTSEPTSWSKDHVPINELFGIVTDPLHETAQNILDTEYMTAEWRLPPRQVLLAGEGHWWITLDYRKGSPPSVAWLDVENNQDIQLARTFAEFVNGLLPIDEFRSKSNT